MARESKASQTNTFIGGMNADLDNSLIQNNQYRYAENVRAIGGDEATSGSLTNVEGPLLVNDNWLKTGERILKTGSIRNIGFAITEQDVDEGVVNFIYRITFDSKTNPVFKNILNPGGLKFDIPNNSDISVVCRYEDHDNIRLYWADGINHLRSINIAQNADESNEMIVDPNYFNITPEIALKAPKIESIGSGRLKSGLIQYGYQLVNSAGSETDLSPLTKQIALSPSDVDIISTKYKGGRIDEIDGVPSGKSVRISIDIDGSQFNRIKVYSVYYANYGDLPQVSIIANMPISGNKAVIVDSGSTVVGELTVEEFNALSSVRRIPGTIESHNNILFIAAPKEDTYDEDYDTRAFSFNHNGECLLYDEQDGNVTFEINDMYLPGFKDIVPVDHDCIVKEKYEKEHYHDLQYIYADDRTKTLGGAGPNVQYRFINTYLIESMGNYLGKVVDKSASVSRANGFIDRRIPRIGSERRNIDNIVVKTSDFSDWSGNIKELPISSFGINPHLGHLDYSNPLISSTFRSYKRDEIYRFAAVLHSKDGRRSPAKWIADIRFPAGYMCEGPNEELRYECNIADNPPQSDGYDESEFDGLRDEELLVKPMGLYFKFKNIPESVSKIEIVRSKRDINNRTIYMQGLVKKIGTYTGEQKFGNTSSVEYVPGGLVNSYRPHPIIGMGDEYAIGGLSLFHPDKLLSAAMNSSYGFSSNYPQFTLYTGTPRAILPFPGSAYAEVNPLSLSAQNAVVLARPQRNISPLFASRSDFFLINTESAIYGESYLLSVKKAIINPSISVQDVLFPMSTPSLMSSSTYFGHPNTWQMAIKLPGDSEYIPTAMYFGADINPTSYIVNKARAAEDRFLFSMGLITLSAHYLKSDANGSQNKYNTTFKGLSFLRGDIDVTSDHNASSDLVYINLGGICVIPNVDGGVRSSSYRNGVYQTGTNRSDIGSDDNSILDHPNAFVDQTMTDSMNSVTFKYYDRPYFRKRSKFISGEYGLEYETVFRYIDRKSRSYLDYTSHHVGAGGVPLAADRLKVFCKRINDKSLKISELSESNSVLPGKSIENAIEYSSIGGKPYLNWAKPLASGDTLNDSVGNVSTNTAKMHVSGPHGDGVLFSLAGQNSFPLITNITTQTKKLSLESYDRDINDWARLREKGRATLASYLIDIKSMNAGIYGGNTNEARQLSEYITTGFYLDNSDITADGYVFGGDTYITILDYTMVRASDPYVKANTTDEIAGKTRESIILSQVKQIGAMIPMESSVNTRMQSGESYCQSDYNQAIQKRPGAYMTAGNNGAKWTSSQRHPEFSYNAVYSEEQTAIGSVSKLDIDESNKDFDSRVYSSGVKTNDELIDQWSKFKVADYIDVETRYGKITRMRSFNNKLIFWQENATGVLSVNERSLITDTDGAALSLGTGGVLSRYDYISTSSGISKSAIDAIGVGSSSLYWFDHNSNSLNTIGQGVTSVSKTKGIQTILNKGISKIEDRIPFIYDQKYNEVLINIKGLSKDDV